MFLKHFWPSLNVFADDTPNYPTIPDLAFGQADCTAYRWLASCRWNPTDNKIEQYNVTVSYLFRVQRYTVNQFHNIKCGGWRFFEPGFSSCPIPVLAHKVIGIHPIKIDYASMESLLEKLSSLLTNISNLNWLHKTALFYQSPEIKEELNDCLRKIGVTPIELYTTRWPCESKSGEEHTKPQSERVELLFPLEEDALVCAPVHDNEEWDSMEWEIVIVLEKPNFGVNFQKNLANYLKEQYASRCSNCFITFSPTGFPIQEALTDNLKREKVAHNEKETVELCFQ